MILPPAGVPSFCAGPPPLRRVPLRVRLVTDAGGELVHAAAGVCSAMPPGSAAVAGLVSGLSEIGPVSSTAPVVIVHGTPPKRHASVSDDDPPTSQFNPIVTVTALTTNENPLST